MFIRQTLRFEVFLDPKSSDNYEVSWIDLIKQNKPVLNDTNKDEVSNMDNLVTAMEKEYGPIVYAKGNKIRVYDFFDKGNGYDAYDDFIDDEEAEEAIILAPNLMTEYGGFFINSKELKINDFNIDKVENGIISSKSPKRHSCKNIGITRKSHQLLIKAKKRFNTTKNIHKKNLSKIPEKKIERIFDEIIAVIEKTSPQKFNVDIDSNENFDSVINISQEKEDDVAKINDNATVTQTKLVELPMGLSDDVMEKVRILIEICDKSKQEGSKVPLQFNFILFELDTILLSSNQKGVKATRSNVMRYISQKSDIKYDTMLRRISKIKDIKKKENSKAMFTAMEDAITDAMVVSMKEFERATKQYVSQVDEQRSIISQSQNPPAEGELESKLKANKIRLPKREFTWSLDCKSLLFKLSRNEFESYQAAINKVALEEHFTKFYQTNIMNLFPSKWMTISKLMKVSQPIIAEFNQTISNGKDSKPVSPKSDVQVKEKLTSEHQLANDIKNKPVLNEIHVTNDVIKPVKPKITSSKKTPRNSSLITSDVIANNSPMLTSNQLINRKRSINGLSKQSPQSKNLVIDFIDLYDSDQSPPKQMRKTGIPSSPLVNNPMLRTTPQQQFIDSMQRNVVEENVPIRQQEIPNISTLFPPMFTNQQSSPLSETLVLPSTPLQHIQDDFLYSVQRNIIEGNESIRQQQIPDISALFSPELLNRQKKSKCSFFPAYCNSTSHMNGSICYQTMENYYQRKVFGRNGYICPGCNSVAIGSFFEFRLIHGHHLCQFSSISKTKIVQLGNIAMLPSSEHSLPRQYR